MFGSIICKKPRSKLPEDALMESEAVSKSGPLPEAQQQAECREFKQSLRLDDSGARSVLFLQTFRHASPP